MRCKNCVYCRYDRADDMYECFLCLDDEENAKGESGCKYNRKTLKKMEKEYWEEERKWGEKLYKWARGEE